MSEPGKAVFLSYASEDAEAARQICEALRAAGVEVWFDQSELVGGDAWDQKIRKHIKECTLLIPVISAATQARTEGYFRLEWRLADQRTHLMAKGRPFLLPIVIDDTRDADAHVPDSFTEVQWTRLKGGEAPPAFVARVKKLLSGEVNVARVSRSVNSDPIMGRETHATTAKSKPIWLWALLALVLALPAYCIFKPRRSPEEIARMIQQAQSIADNATKPANPAKAASDAGSKPEVASLLARVDVIAAKTDVFRSELDTATSLLEQAARLDADNAGVWAEWALIDWRYGVEYFDRSPARFDAARRHVAQAMSLDPTLPVARLAQALVMTMLNEDAATQSAAVKILESLLPELPNDGRVPLELGWHTFDRDHPEVALGWFDRTAKMPGQAGRAHFGRAIAFMMLGSLDRTEAELDQALTIERAHSFLLWKAYLLTIWNGDVAAAKRVLAEIPPQLWVEDMPAMTRYFVESTGRDYDQALAALRAVPHDYLESVAFSGPAGYFKGDLLARAGKPAAAQLEWRSALAVVERRLATEPNDQALMQFKALLLACLGDKAAADQVWKAELELYGDKGGYGAEQLLRTKLLPANEAFDWVADKVAKSRPIATAARLRLDPAYDPIRSDSRFPALLAQAEANPRLSPSTKTQPGVGAPAAVDEKSIAVLAFANLSDDKGNEYFSDGISEELLNVLAKIPGLKVAARTSAFYFKGKEVQIPEIARQLGVAYVVEGSVRKSGDKVRITAQLIKASDGFHVWSDTFTRDLKDIFAVQDEIAGLIAQNLSLEMGMAPAASRRAVNPEAHRLVLEGRYFWNLRTMEGFARAETAFTKAIGLDPQFAQAHAGLADVLIARAIYQGYEGSNTVTAPSAISEAERALAIDPRLAEAYPAKGTQLMCEGRLGEAEQVFKQAIGLNPNYALAHHWYALTLERQGRLDVALDEIEQAIRLDPLSVAAISTRARFLMSVGRVSEALADYGQGLAMRPNFLFVQGDRALCLHALDRTEEALAVARLIAANPAPDRRWIADAEVVHLLRQTGHQAEADDAAARQLARFPSDSFLRGFVLAAQGRQAEALPFLERTPAALQAILFWNPIWDPWREDPRFRQLLVKLGCAESYKVARETMARMLKDREAKR